MNLMTKFAILVLMLAGMMFVAVGIPTWAVATVDRNVVRNQGALVEMLMKLKKIEAASSAVLARQRAGETLMPASKHLRSQFSELADLTAELTLSADFRKMAGAGLGPSLIRRLEEVGAIVDNFEIDSVMSEEVSAEVIEHFLDLHTLVSMIAQQLESNIYYSIQHSGKIRTLIGRILISTSVAAVLVAILSFLLLRRWVMVPVLELRTAAREIGRGHFDYRVTIRARDEIGALAHEVNEMAGTIATMQEQVVARERLHAIEEILRRIVHNLRNPLAGIRGLAEATCLDLPQESRVREDQNLIIAMVDRFEKWLGELLHSTTSLRINALSDSPAELVQMVVQTVQPLASAKSIELDVEVDAAPAEACFDPMHLEHALVALTTNALEASAKGGHVRISAEILEEVEDDKTKPSRWHICVEDSGAGVPVVDRADIFQPYFSTKTNGTGLGLALVQNVVTAHQGMVTIGDSELGGARFDVELPMKGNCNSNSNGSGHGNGGEHG